MTRPAPHVSAMSPYGLARMTPPKGKPLISLAQNESLRGPSPLAVRAATRAMGGAACYPDPDWIDLRDALADHHGLHPATILCGAGSLDLIGSIARVYCGPGRAVLAPAHAYPFFRTAALMAGARFDTAPENGTTVSVDALLSAVKPDTSLVCVANPGNPTGTRIPASELRRLRDGLRGDILMIIDEAYGEFSDHLAEPTFDLGQDNTIVLRTFSKAYGLAGARVGWGVFPPAVAAELRKVLNPNNITAASQAAATAAVRDYAYMRETCTLTARARDDAIDRLRRTGFAVQDSHTNFLLIDLGTAGAAQLADRMLQSEGIFLRGQAGAGLSHALRMTIGPAPAMEAALARLEIWHQEIAP